MDATHRALALLASLLLWPASAAGAQSFVPAGADFLAVGRSSAELADVDADGHLDLLVTGEATGEVRTATLYLGDGRGGFTRAEAGLGGVAGGDVSVGDVNGDGHLDAVVTGSDVDGFRSATVYLGDGQGGFTDAHAGLVGVMNGSTSLGDVDGDGRLDLVVAGDPGPYAAPRTTLYLGDGRGGFQRADADLADVALATTSLGDVDEDGDLDLFITGVERLVITPGDDGSRGPVSALYLGDGRGGFQRADVELPAVTWGESALEDVDGDGHLDLLVTGRSAGRPTAVLYLGDGNGGFTDAGSGLAGVFSSAYALGDVDGDGAADLVLAGRSGGDAEPSTALYLGDGGGGFRRADAWLAGVKRGSASLGDVNEDGRPDLVLTGTGAGNRPLSMLYLGAASPGAEGLGLPRSALTELEIDRSLDGETLQGYRLLFNEDYPYVHFTRDGENLAAYDYRKRTWYMATPGFDTGAIDLRALFREVEVETPLLLEPDPCARDEPGDGYEPFFVPSEDKLVISEEGSPVNLATYDYRERSWSVASPRFDTTEVDLGMFLRPARPPKPPEPPVPHPKRTAGPFTEAKRDRVARYLFEISNAYRRGVGAQPVERDPVLEEVACRHSRDMLERDYLGHVNPDGESPSDRVARGHRRLVATVGENAASDESPEVREMRLADLARAFLRDWRSSPPHRRNLQAIHSHLGACVVWEDGRARATQLFADAYAYLEEPLPRRTSPGARRDLSLDVRQYGGEEPVAYRFEALDGAAGSPGEPVPFHGTVRFPRSPGRYRLLFIPFEGLDGIPGPAVRVAEGGG